MQGLCQTDQFDELNLCGHSEKLALGFGLISTSWGQLYVLQRVFRSVPIALLLWNLFLNLQNEKLFLEMLFSFISLKMEFVHALMIGEWCFMILISMELVHRITSFSDL